MALYKTNRNDKIRIGVFSDTHGNLGALQAICSLFERLHCDEVIHCGDMVAMGGESLECLDFLFSSKIHLIKGNHDKAYARNKTIQTGQSHVSQAHKEFVYASLGRKYVEEIGNLPLYLYRNYFGTKFVFTHYALSPQANERLGLTHPSSERDSSAHTQQVERVIDNKQTDIPSWTPIYQCPTREIFDEIFSCFDADYVVFGHKHEPVSISGNKQYFDIGSVGCHNLQCASAVIFDIDNNGFVTTRRVYTPYDRKRVFRIMKERNIPDADEIFDYYFKESLNR